MNSEFPIFVILYDYRNLHFFCEFLMNFLSGFRDKFQKKSDVCRFCNQICENNQKIAEISEICENLIYKIIQYYSIQSCPQSEVLIGVGACPAAG